MVDTIKFSQMTNAGNINNNDIMPSLRTGENVILNNPWTFLPPGTTAQRPAPSATINYRLRFNTDDQLYEYYNAVLAVWTQLEEGAVTQGPFVTYTAAASLPDAQNLGLLADGILIQTIAAGIATIDILAIPLMPAYGGTGINNGTKTIDLSTPTTGYVLTSDASGNATWQVVSTSGAITSIDGDSGTATPTAGVVSIEAAATGLSFTGSGSTLSLGGLLTSTFGGTGVSDPTAHGIMVAEGSSPVTPIVLSDGQILIGSTGIDPVAAAIGSGTGILVANGAGSISVGLAPIATLNLLSNITGGSAAPIANTLTATIDAAIGSTRGDILYRNATIWTVLAPGTAGFSLQTGGAGADPSYSNTFTNSTFVTPATLGVQQQALNMNNHLINNVTDPVSAQDAMTLNYAGLTYLALAGGTMTGDISLGSAHRVTNALDPINPQEYATKFYVDTTALNGTAVYAASAATLGTVTQSGAGVGATLTNAGVQAVFALDGVNPPAGSDVLIKDTATGMTSANEGIYTVLDVGSGSSNWQLRRSTTYDTAVEINNTGLIAIRNGSTLAGQAWYNSTTIVTVDTTAFNYNRFGSTGTVTSVGSGLGLTGGPITSSGTLAVTGILADIVNNVIAPVKNIVIGGNFDTNPWQRGTSFVAPASGTYTADRITFNLVGTGVINIQKTADAPTAAQAGIFSSNCFDWDVTTADAAMAAADVYNIRYAIEGYDFAQLAQRPFTLSFWVKSTKTGIFSVGFRNGGADRTYVSEYTVNTTDTWEKKTITVPASPSGGTWNYTNGNGLAIFFTVACGSNFFTGSLNTWNSDALLASSNQVNGMDSASNNFKLQLVQIEPGSEANGFEVRSFEEELALCQRYFEKSYNQGVDPGTASGVGMTELVTGIATTGQVGRSCAFAVTKRVTPTTVSYDAAGTAGTIYLSGNNGDAAVAGNPGMSNVCFLGTRAGATVVLYHWTADAEI